LWSEHQYVFHVVVGGCALPEKVIILNKGLITSVNASESC